MEITDIIEDFTDVDDDDETAIRKVNAIIESLPEAGRPVLSEGHVETLIRAGRRGLV